MSYIGKKMQHSVDYGYKTVSECVLVEGSVYHKVHSLDPLSALRH